MQLVRNLIDEEPGGEEEANAEEDEGEVREHRGVDWRDVAGEGVQGGHGHLDVCKFDPVSVRAVETNFISHVSRIASLKV